MNTTSLNNTLALLGYTALGSSISLLIYQINPTQIIGNSLIIGLSSSALGLSLGLVLENSRPIKVIEEKNETKITKFSIGGVVLEVARSSLTPTAIIIASFVLSNALSKK